MQPALALPAPPIVPALMAPPLPPAPAPALDPVAPLMLFGLDQSGKPHGAQFDGGASAVERAADLMDLYLVTADTDVLRALAVTLPQGRLFGSGRAFVPFIKAGLYDRLLAAAGLPAPPRPANAAAKPAEAGGSVGGGQGRRAGGAGAGDPPANRAAVKAPADHTEICVGALVLAEDEIEGGYYPAEVVATKADDAFVLRWAGYDLPEFFRARRALGLLHPEASEAAE